MYKKKGRPLKSKLKPVAAFNKNTLEFVAFFKNPSHASKVLRGNYSNSTNIRRCSDHKLYSAVNHIFEWVEDEEINTETVKKLKAKLLTRENFKFYLIKDNNLRLPISIIKTLNITNETKFKIKLEGKNLIITIIDK